MTNKDCKKKSDSLFSELNFFIKQSFVDKNETELEDKTKQTPAHNGKGPNLSQGSLHKVYKKWIEKKIKNK